MFMANEFATKISVASTWILSMARSASPNPTEVELQILRILWEAGPSPVREIHRQLQAEKGTNYSTTVKMLGVMLEKRLVKRNESARPHIYRAVLSREKAGTRMLNNIVEKVYDGSSFSLVLQALSTSRSTPEEIAEVRRLLDTMEGK
jgi:predicted transcriptional regulator